MLRPQIIKSVQILVYHPPRILLWPIFTRKWGIYSPGALFYNFKSDFILLCDFFCLLRRFYAIIVIPIESKNMKQSFLIPFLCLSIAFGTFAQTSISGTPNVYTNLASQDFCTNTITVTDGSVFTENMGIIIIQMQGANLDLSNSDSYGDITDLNGAGQYEYNRIVEINGNDLLLEFELINIYQTAFTQVVGFDIYDAASVDGTLTPASWDGSTGGVLVLEVNGTLTINADIDASFRGFRGGVDFAVGDNNCNFLTNADDYAYETTNWRGSPKGEGIGFAAASAPHGRGAQANGGGGGNDHNSGGGGGSLLSAGGQGGINDEPSTFGCDGDFPGRGGKSLSNAGNLLFLGGGGGSGHANNGENNGGGAGGGIIIIKAGTINFNSGSISTNGEDASNISGDGGGGGGAGGSLLLLTDNIMGTPQISAVGGTGATVNNGNNDRCFGPGGGGSGGALWSNQSLSAQLDGGIAGLSINSTSCGEGTNGAVNGMSGPSNMVTDWIAGAPFTIPAILAQSADTIVCVGETVNLEVETVGNNLLFQWQQLIDGNWTDLTEMPGTIIGTQTPLLQIVAGGAAAGQYRVQLSSSDGCLDNLNSSPIFLEVVPPVAATPTFSLMGNTASFVGNISNATAIEWRFEPGQTSNAENPEYTFPGPGTYPVSLLVSNSCGEEIINIEVVINEPLNAVIGVSSSSGCAPFTVIFEDQTLGNVTTRNWLFPGGDPMSSTAASPVVTFTNPGSYEVSLDVSNGTTDASSSITIEVSTPPVPSFSFMTDQLMVMFQNNSTNASSYFWNFGDGNTSTEASPTHTYSTPGTYTVSLNSSNTFCSVASTQTINVSTTSVEDVSEAQIKVFPNPARDWLQVEHWHEGAIRLYQLDGKLIRQWSSPTKQLEISQLPAGMYMLVLPGEQLQYQKLLIH